MLLPAKSLRAHQGQALTSYNVKPVTCNLATGPVVCICPIVHA